MTLESAPLRPFAGPSTADILAFSDRRARAFPARRIALVGGFAPRKCGIATFTTDIFEQLAAHQPQLTVDVWALEEAGDPPADDRVVGRIDANDAESFRTAARSINEAGYDAVWLQHEYGIFGGEEGAMVLDFAERLAPPLIVTLHTVLSEPSEQQATIIERLAALASRIMVMSQRGRELLIERHGVDAARITVVAHGAPERPFGRQAEFRRRLGHDGRVVLMTFGLLGPGKGIENMIAALPAIIARHPEVVYRIVGATHPRLVAAQGEAYREKLEACAAELGVGDHIVFDNRFL